MGSELKNNGDNLSVGLVSIIIPVYNCAQYLPQCIESVVNQTYKNIEIILIDDGSTDESRNICDRYAQKDNQVVVVHEENGGPSAARNKGIEISKGDFIFFLDGDDYLENEAINLLVTCCNQNKADIIIGDFYKVNETRVNSGHERFFYGDKLMGNEQIVEYAICYLNKPNRFPLFAYSWGRLFKTSIIKNNKIFFNTDLHTFEDVAFNFNYLGYANSVFFLKTIIYNHRIHSNYSSATMAVGDNLEQMFGYRSALAEMQRYLKNYDSNMDVGKKIGHADICLTIIQLVRICGQINHDNKEKIYQFIRKMIGSPSFRGDLLFYSPTKGDSKIVPILMKLRLAWSIMIVCKYKANKRYKKTNKNII